jgi:hypothetical protein
MSHVSLPGLNFSFKGIYLLLLESAYNLMSDVRHDCVFCYYNGCHGNVAKRFSSLREVTAGLYVPVIPLPRDSRSHDLHY